MFKETKKIDSISNLRKICQSPYMDPEGPLSEAFKRKTYYKISIYFTWLFLHTKLSPTRITLISIIVGLTACALVPMPYLFPIIGVILFQIWYILDMVDGDVARYRNTCSLSGAFVDRLNSAIIEPLTFVFLSFAIFQRFQDSRVFLFGFSAALSILLLKIVFSYLHIAILEPKLHNKHMEMFTDLSHSSSHDPKWVTDYLKGRPSSPLLKIAELLLGHGLQISFYSSIIIDTITRFSIPFFSFNLNLSYVYLMLSGILLQIVWIVTAIYTVKNKAAEKLYASLFSGEKDTLK